MGEERALLQRAHKSYSSNATMCRRSTTSTASSSMSGCSSQLVEHGAVTSTPATRSLETCSHTPATEHTAQESPAPSRTALVVDDSAIHRFAASSILKHLGFDVQEAKNGVEGLEKMKERTFDVVLCDYEMPDMDGFGCAEQLRLWEGDHRSEHERQRIVCFTSALDLKPDIAVQGLTVGMDLMVLKPYTKSKVESALEQVL